MRPDPFDLDRDPYRDPYDPMGGMAPPTHGDADAPWHQDGYSSNLPVAYRRRRIPWRWIARGFGALIVLFIVAVAWLAFTAPLSKSLQPPTPPSVTLLADDGTPIARTGAIVAAPVDAAKLPKHVTQAFLAIEDRRFYSHWGVDPRGILRAALHNAEAGGVREGGSTITQQLAKNAFLDADRTAGRKMREVLIAFWLEAWLTKDQILSRYLSNVYFGDNVYGLRAAAKHYFGRAPEDLSVGQAAMLAGMVKAPSRLAPTNDLKAARAREAVVLGAMVDAGFLSKSEAADARPAKPVPQTAKQLPDGTYFTDWVLPAARDTQGEMVRESSVKTTLDPRMQRAAERAVRRAGLKTAQIALVAMRPDGRVVAMVGGKDYAKSPFNRATQARRQPGSAFKIFVYLAAMRAGMTPDTMIDDEPVTIANWSPKNADGRYLGKITLRQAFARSSNVAAARLIQKVGVGAVIRAARDLGISTPLPNEATIALGTSTVSLLELTGAYAAIAADAYPVQPHGLDDVPEKNWYQTLTDRSHPISGTIRSEMLELLAASAQDGTGKQAALSVDTYGKTGTTQDNRDALFMGFANGLVCGVWVGNDDNSPNPGLSGGGIPARVWRDFMTQALGVSAAVHYVPATEEVDPDALPPDDDSDNASAPLGGLEGDIQGLGLNLHFGNDGSITVDRRRDRDQPADRRRDMRERGTPRDDGYSNYPPPDGTDDQ